MWYEEFKKNYNIGRDARGILRWYKKPEKRKQPTRAQGKPRIGWQELVEKGRAQPVLDENGKVRYYKLIGSARKAAANELMQKYRDVLKKRGMPDEAIKEHFDNYYHVKTTRQGRLAVQVKPDKRASMRRMWARNARERARNRQQVPKSLPRPRKCGDVITHREKTYEVACNWRLKQ